VKYGQYDKMSDKELTMFSESFVTIVLQIHFAFYLSGAISGFPFQVLIKKSKVSNVLKRASAGRFFKTGNFCFFNSGLYTSNEIH
jgi:hypothetical protein